VRAALVVVQVAISFVLIVGAGLVVESLYHMRTKSPGFDADRVLVTYIDLAAADYDITRANMFKDRLIELVSSLPGVEGSRIRWRAALLVFWRRIGARRCRWVRDAAGRSADGRVHANWPRVPANAQHPAHIRARVHAR
jgi:hypothetical protein